MSEIMLVGAIGLAAGLLGGFFGVAGGVVIVPALVLIMAMPQPIAVGTSLAALLPPVGLLGAFEYYREGQVNVTYALLLAAGVLIGAGLGAMVAVRVSPHILRLSFAIFLVIVAVRMMFE